MSVVLGIDTSNYTTSAATYNGVNGEYTNSRQILTVKSGEVGLRQSDALFQHTKNLPEIIKKALDCKKIEAIGVSTRPRAVEDSYMPVFLAGTTVAESIAATMGIPLYKFSHQAGHIAAALFSADKMDLIGKEFISFHISGGTSEAVKVSYSKENFFNTEIVAKSLDLKMGQAVDRVGNMLGLQFPAGKELDRLSLEGELPKLVKPSIKDFNFSISGLENQAAELIKNGARKEDVALFTITYICKTLEKTVLNLKKEFGDIPLVFAGGVMSNTIIRNVLTEKYGVFFASKELSSDNAVGIAVMTDFILNS